MKVEFPKLSSKEIVTLIQNAMGGRALSEMVSFEAKPDSIVVTISKLGTSTLTFDLKEHKEKTELNLGQEKIAFTHKAFKDEVKDKLNSVIQKAGGKIIA